MNTKHEFHNPDNLTPEQIGEGYRLLLKSEIKKNREENPDIQCWISGGLLWGANFGDGYCGSEKSLTYRVPLSTWPLPEAVPQCSPGSEGPHGEPTDWIPWHGGKCPLKDEWVEEWGIRTSWGEELRPDWKPSEHDWRHLENTSINRIIAYRVLKWKEKPYAAPPVKSPEVAELQERFAEPLPPVETFPAAMEAVTKQESTPTDNDAWESLLHTNADLKREVSELKKELKGLSQDYADSDAEIVNLQAQLQGVITACHLRGYNVGDPLGEWIEKQFEDAEAKLKATEARLAQLEWIPFSERLPSRADGDSRGYVLTANNKAHFVMWYNDTPAESTHWRPFTPPTLIDTERVEFEKWWSARCVSGEEHKTNLKDAMHDAWKAARRTK